MLRRAQRGERTRKRGLQSAQRGGDAGCGGGEVGLSEGGGVVMMGAGELWRWGTEGNVRGMAVCLGGVLGGLLGRSQETDNVKAAIERASELSG